MRRSKVGVVSRHFEILNFEFEELLEGEGSCCLFAVFAGPCRSPKPLNMSVQLDSTSSYSTRKVVEGNRATGRKPKPTHRVVDTGEGCGHWAQLCHLTVSLTIPSRAFPPSWEAYGDPSKAENSPWRHQEQPCIPSPTDCGQRSAADLWEAKAAPVHESQASQGERAQAGGEGQVCSWTVYSASWWQWLSWHRDNELESTTRRWG